MKLFACIGVITLPTLLTCGGAKAASELHQALQDCRAVKAETARLACFDAMADAPRAPTVRGTESPPGLERARIQDAKPSFTAKPVTAPESATKFGLAAPPSEILRSIDFEFPEVFEGWGPDERIVLPNGQEWLVVDGTRAVYRLTRPKARIVRGILGVYFLEVEGITQRARVRRIR